MWTKVLSRFVLYLLKKYYTILKYNIEINLPKEIKRGKLDLGCLNESAYWYGIIYERGILWFTI